VTPACPITSTDGWMLCSLPAGHEGPHAMRSVAIGDKEATTPLKCPDCDRPLATKQDYDCACDGEPCVSCNAKCWRAECGDVCQHVDRIDWRARALAAEAEVKDLRSAVIHVCTLNSNRRHDAATVWAIRETANRLSTRFSLDACQRRMDEMDRAGIALTAERDQLRAALNEALGIGERILSADPYPEQDALYARIAELRKLVTG
jgi:hypothetical protein